VCVLASSAATACSDALYRWPRGKECMCGQERKENEKKLDGEAAEEEIRERREKGGERKNRKRERARE